MKKINVVLMIVLGLWISLSTTGCDVFGSQGYPELTYTIPNITLVSGVEQYSRDLEAHPRVFTHTGGGRLYYDAFSDKPSVADAWVDNGFLYVTAGVPGETIVRVEAEDSDGDYDYTEFLVTIIPTAPSQ